MDQLCFRLDTLFGWLLSLGSRMGPIRAHLSNVGPPSGINPWITQVPHIWIPACWVVISVHIQWFLVCGSNLFTHLARKLTAGHVVYES